MNDNELFELCRQVHEATRWAMDKAPMFHNVAGGLAVISWEDYYSGKYTSVPPYPIPLYTTDYLLEKLPKSYKTSLFKLYRSVQNTWWAGYAPLLEIKDDTPLKALLKLALKLHEEKIL